MSILELINDLIKKEYKITFSADNKKIASGVVYICIETEKEGIKAKEFVRLNHEFMCDEIELTSVILSLKKSVDIILQTEIRKKLS